MRRAVRGFSLLELMIVLALMVGLLAIAWPSMQQQLRRTTLLEAAQVLREAIDEGRHEAITTGKPIFIQMQNDNHEVRSGAFATFANEPSENNIGSKSLGIESQESSLESHSHEKTPRTWRLPDTIVITEVNWTSNGSNDPADEGQLASTHGSGRSAGEANQEAKADGITGSESSIAEHGPPHSDWWLPISATGQSRNASIVLYDTSIHQTMTVTYASETGALEIVR